MISLFLALMAAIVPIGQNKMCDKSCVLLLDSEIRQINNMKSYYSLLLDYKEGTGEEELFLDYLCKLAYLKVETHGEDNLISFAWEKGVIEELCDVNVA